MFEVTLWVLFGALTGWIVSLLVRNSKEVQVLTPVVVGIIGAVVGGLLFRTYNKYLDDKLSYSVLSAIGGAIFLLSIVVFIRQK